MNTHTHIKDILNTMRANRYTYYNVGSDNITIYKQLYKYISKHKNKAITHIGMMQYNNISNDNTDYINKIKAMQIISTNIIH